MTGNDEWQCTNTWKKEIRKIYKVYNCSLDNELWLLKYVGRPTPKKDDKDGVQKSRPYMHTQIEAYPTHIGERWY